MGLAKQVNVVRHDQVLADPPSLRCMNHVVKEGMHVREGQDRLPLVGAKRDKVDVPAIALPGNDWKVTWVFSAFVRKRVHRRTLQRASRAHAMHAKPQTRGVPRSRQSVPLQDRGKGQMVSRSPSDNHHPFLLHWDARSPSAAGACFVMPRGHASRHIAGSISH